ncbi:hypothetical protein M231_00290 [Tremella mesenterica]|uniref:Uncharacterized protein n=1 Tax=Tremella mesenterica TaxID=5217 RepID=A0A4Q1BVY7_TREME|nr:uncharacterized protein TREMEDRAFT_63557 [Tremella mesenterica DSM 1558]EIW68388.1 hypothetical protein TREMEDRAFT_63557 [Tremella mesenterica DSM 1558]RXK42300.1 hypothetical protein M231_00290 [Tremella mesenterica]
MLSVLNLLLCLIGMVNIVSAGGPSRIDLSNGERMKRGLPVKTPRKLYNATATSAHLARRSAAPFTGYLVATPQNNGGLKKRTPYDQTSYLYYDTDYGFLRLSTIASDASLFVWTTAGTEQYLGVSDDGDSTSDFGVCASVITIGSGVNMEPNAPGGPTSAIFSQCPTAYDNLTPSQASGQGIQGPIFDTPSSLPAIFSAWFLNQDDTITTDALYWVFDTPYYTDALGMALSASDFEPVDAVQTEQITLEYVASLA